MANQTEITTPNPESIGPVLTLMVDTLLAALADGKLLSDYFDEIVTLRGISLALLGVMTKRDIPVERMDISACNHPLDSDGDIDINRLGVVYRSELFLVADRATVSVRFTENGLEPQVLRGELDGQNLARTGLLLDMGSAYSNHHWYVHIERRDGKEVGEQGVRHLEQVLMKGPYAQYQQQQLTSATLPAGLCGRGVRL